METSQDQLVRIEIPTTNRKLGSRLGFGTFSLWHQKIYGSTNQLAGSIYESDKLCLVKQETDEVEWETNRSFIS